MADKAELINEGEIALKHGEWQKACNIFRKAVSREETPAALEGLGTALWWLDEQSEVLEVREHAFRLYRSAGDLRSAARVATALAIDYLDYRSDGASSNGWIQRAEHLLDQLPLSDEHAWLQVYCSLKALMFDHDLGEAQLRCDRATSLSRELANLDVEMMAVALEGLLLLREGNVATGMLRLDEAMTAAVGGEMTDLPSIGNTCCYLIYACEAVADYDRATQWCERTREFCRRMGMDPFFSICRNYYATTLIWRGAWEEAEAELSSAAREHEPTRPGYAKESLAKLGELRRRQGRTEEAASLFRRAEPHRLAFMGGAALALDSGDPESAIDLLKRQLRHIGEEEMAERVFALALMVQSQLAAGDANATADTLHDLESTVSIVGTQPLRATANYARGLLARTLGQRDQAKLHFEDAIDLFQATGAEFDAARVRLDLAQVLQELGRAPSALEQAMLARGVFQRLGARLYGERANSIVSSVNANKGTPPSSLQLPHDLTQREAEVLWRLASGKANQEIAEELVLSIRTVERHISTIYQKLQVHGPSARASAAAIALGLRHDT